MQPTMPTLSGKQLGGLAQVQKGASFPRGQGTHHTAHEDLDGADVLPLEVYLALSRGVLTQPQGQAQLVLAGRVCHINLVAQDQEGHLQPLSVICSRLGV